MTKLTIDDMVRREVVCSASSLVSTLAKGFGSKWDSRFSDDLPALCNQAFELSAPILDYEEAAFQEGWTGPHSDQYGAIYFKNESESTQNVTWCASDWQ